MSYYINLITYLHWYLKSILSLIDSERIEDATKETFKAIDIANEIAEHIDEENENNKEKFAQLCNVLKTICLDLDIDLKNR